MFNRLRAQESGFTLIELLMAIAVSGLILGAVVTAFLVTMAGSQNVHERFVSSHDAQLLSTYFPADVQSANPAMINPTTPGCGGTMLGNEVIRLDWDESDGASTTLFSASYRLEGSTSGSTLRRYFCSGTSLAAETATATRVASNLADPAVQPPAEVEPLDNLPRIDLTLHSYRTESEVRAGIPVYSYTFSAHIRTPSSSPTSTSPTTTPTTSPDTTPPPDPTGVTAVSTKNNEVTMTFGNPEAGVTFECAVDSVDSSAFSSCTSPWVFKGPQYDGLHDYHVRAVDAAENRSGIVSALDVSA